MNTSVTLVIPCKDEAKRLNTDEFLKAVSDHPYLSLLFVDDGSTDDTAEMLAFMERQSPAISALYLPQNVGKAEAVRSGVNWLLVHTHTDFIGFWDADLATPLAELDSFIQQLVLHPKCQAAFGARWPHLGAQIDRLRFRSFTATVMKILIRFVLRIPVYDTQCGAKIFRRELAERVFCNRFISRWLFDVEIIRRIPRQQAYDTIAEVPLSFWRDVADSKLGFRDSLKLLPDLLRIWLSHPSQPTHTML